jgi:hypothetical protein
MQCGIEPTHIHSEKWSDWSTEEMHPAPEQPLRRHADRVGWPEPKGSQE